MLPLNMTANDNARELRAEEMRHIEGLAETRLGEYGRRLGAIVLAVLGVVSELLRPLFSWNPRAKNARG